MSRDETTVLGIELDRKCTSCFGGGVDDDVLPCTKCKGACRELTPAGAAILDFVMRWCMTDCAYLIPRRGRIEGPR